MELNSTSIRRLTSIEEEPIAEPGEKPKVAAKPKVPPKPKMIQAPNGKLKPVPPPRPTKVWDLWAAKQQNNVMNTIFYCIHRNTYLGIQSKRFRIHWVLYWQVPDLISLAIHRYQILRIQRSHPWLLLSSFWSWHQKRFLNLHPWSCFWNTCSLHQRIFHFQ